MRSARLEDCPTKGCQVAEVTASTAPRRWQQEYCRSEHCHLGPGICSPARERIKGRLQASRSRTTNDTSTGCAASYVNAGGIDGIVPDNKLFASFKNCKLGSAVMKLDGMAPVSMFVPRLMYLSPHGNTTRIGEWRRALGRCIACSQNATTCYMSAARP